jgi:hypothetical protein
MPKQVVGTHDHYYDAAEKLDSMDVKFVLLVQPHDGALIMLSTIESPDEGRRFMDALRAGLENRFRDETSSDGPPV